MTKRDFFISLLKVFGLFSAIAALFSSLPSYLSFAIASFDWISLFWVSVASIVVIGLFLLLIFKSENIVSILKLDSGFDTDHIDFGNLKAVDLIKIGTFVVGGFLILDNIPTFLGHTLYAFKGEQMGLESTPRDNLMWTMSGLNLIIGYILITNYHFVAARFYKHEKGETTTSTNHDLTS